MLHPKNKNYFSCSGTRKSQLIPAIFVIAGIFVTSLDQTFVVTVLPQIMWDFRLPTNQLDHAAWIVTGYFIGYVVSIPLMARIADTHGHFRVLRAALVVCSLGTISAALSTDINWLIGSRVLQAIGSGTLLPIGMTVVSRPITAQRKWIAIGVIAAVTELGLVMGPIYGGFIDSVLGWRWLFILQVPIIAIVIGGLLRIKDPPLTRSPINYQGGVLLAITLTLITATLSQRDLFFSMSQVVIYLSLASLVALSLFTYSQLRSSNPLLPNTLFKSKFIVAAFAIKLLMGTGLIIGLLTVPLMANTIFGLTAFQGGLLLLRLTGALPFGAILGGYLVKRFGPRIVVAIGLILGSTGLWLMSRWGTEVPSLWDSSDLIIVGLGFGLVITPIFATVLDFTPEPNQATAAGLVTISRMIGMCFGLAAFSAWGMESFTALTQNLALPIPLLGETQETLDARILSYQQGILYAGISVFQSFLALGAFITAIALIPASLLPSRGTGIRTHTR